MLIRSERSDPHKQLDDPSENQMAEHAAAIALFLARPVMVVAGAGERMHIAVSVVDSASTEHPDTEVTLVAAGIDAETVRRTAVARYAKPNEDSYDRVPALWATYVMSVPMGTPLDVVIGTIETMRATEVAPTQAKAAPGPTPATPGTQPDAAEPGTQPTPATPGTRPTTAKPEEPTPPAEPEPAGTPARPEPAKA